MVRVGLLGLALAVLGGLAGEARATEEREGPILVVMGEFEGTRARLKKVDKALKKAFKAKKVRGDLKWASEEEAGQARVIVDGALVKEGRIWKLTLFVRDAETKEAAWEKVYEHKWFNKITRALSKGFVADAKGAIEAAWEAHRIRELKAKEPPPPPPEPEPEPEPEPLPEPEPEPEPAGGPTALSAALGARVLSRSFAYADDLFGVLRGYELSAGPALTLGLSWFPGAHLGDGIGAHFGLGLSGHVLLGVDTEGDGGQSFGTGGFGFHASLLGRIPLAAHALVLAVGYGMDSFTFDAAGGVEPPMPDVQYGFVRAGGDFELVILRDLLVLNVGGAYRIVLDSGELGEDTWWPRADVGGFDAYLDLSVGLAAGLEIRAGFLVHHYFMTMNPEPGDPFVAGGATDTYLTGLLALGYRL